MKLSLSVSASPFIFRARFGGGMLLSDRGTVHFRWAVQIVALFTFGGLFYRLAVVVAEIGGCSWIKFIGKIKCLLKNGNLLVD